MFPSRCLVLALFAIACGGNDPGPGSSDTSDPDPAPVPSTDTSPGPGATGTTGDTGTTAPPASAFGHWTWVNPLPQGAPLHQIRFVNDDTAFAITDGGGVLRTDDAGATWTTQYGIQELGYGTHDAMSFIDADQGWLVGRQGRIVHTDDGGATWTDQSPPNLPFDLFDVQFTSALHGVAVGATGRILRTDDGGGTWVEATHPGGSTFFRAVVFVSGTVGWVGGDDGRVMSTTDGGTTWELVNTPFDEDILRGAPLGTTGAAFATRTELHAFNGTSWTRPLSADQVFDIQYGNDAPAGAALIFADGSTALSTLGPGPATRRPLTLDPSPSTFALRGDKLLLGGFWGALYASADAGNTFAEGRTLPVAVGADAQFLDVSFVGDHAIAVGFDGVAVYSDDGGRTWTPATSTTTVDLRSVDLHESGVAVAVGYSTTPEGRVPGIVRSTDHGATWTSAPVSVQDAVLNGIAMWDAQRGVAAGFLLPSSDELVLLTSDGGATWQVRDPSTTTFGFVSVATAGTGHAWLGAGFGKVVRTENGGDTWTEVDSGTNRAFESVDFINDQTGWAATRTRDLLATTDGGATWQTYDTGGTSFVDVSFADATRGLAIAGAGNVWGTDDGGQTWTRQPAGWSGSAQVRAVSMRNRTDAIIVGTEAKISITRSGGGLDPLP